MVRSVILFPFILFSVSANIAGSNLGMQFVAACPWLMSTSTCAASLTTPEQYVRVTVTVKDGRAVDVGNVREFILNIHQTRVAEIAKAKSLTSRAHESGIYSVSIIQASGAIRVIVMAIKAADSMDTFVLIPKRSCHRSYYTTTTNGNPFIAVMSFDDPITKVVVTFPKYMTSYFQEKCSVGDVCTRGKTINLSLLQYQAWYLSVIGKGKNLHGAQVTSDHPVYVIAGNEDCTSFHSGNSDICVSSMKSTVTWGKTYIVPNIFPQKAFFIDVLEPPLLVTFHESGKDPQTRTVRVGAFEVYGETSNALAVTAGIPFGLYQMLILPSRENEASTLNLIPVEQWFRRCVFTKFFLASNTDRGRYLILTNANIHDVVLPETDEKITWHTSAVTVNDIEYSIGEVNLDNAETRIYAESLSSSLMLYVILKRSQLPREECLLTFPYQFYHREIYQSKCNMSINLSLDDGIDNDCDGFIDEEEMNRVDDDGDGLVDEDNVEPFDDTDGQWGSWNTLCNITCRGKRLSVRVRACDLTSHYGLFCERGSSIQCNKSQCPEDCGFNIGCYCDAGCETCEENMFSCDSCKAGYMPTRHCTTRCPYGRAGRGCMDTVPIKGRTTGVANSNEAYWLWIFAFSLSVITLQLLLLAMATFWFFSKLDGKEVNKELRGDNGFG